jgi:nucleotide-binding universal stress UspA family protein
MAVAEPRRQAGAVTEPYERDWARRPYSSRASAKEHPITTSTRIRPGIRNPRTISQPRERTRRSARPRPAESPIVAAIDDSSAANAASHAAVRLALEIAAPVVFMYVRRGPSLALGRPYYQRRLDREVRIGRRALNEALALAERAGVPATGEELEGDPARRVVEFARGRGARMVVLGSRRRRLRPSIARRVIRKADRPVLVAGRTAPAAA